MEGKKEKRIFTRLVGGLSFRSLQFIITVSFTFITVLAMLFVALTLYKKFSDIAEQNTSISNEEVVEQVNMNLDHYMRSMIEISDLLENNIHINQYSSRSKLEEYMNIILSTRKDIVTIALFTEDEDAVACAPSLPLKNNVVLSNQDWFQIHSKNSDNLYFSSPHVQNLFPKKHNWVVSLSRKVTFMKNNKPVKGVLLIDMNFRTIEEICQRVNLGKKGYVYIMHSNGSIIFHPQQQLVYVGLKYENHYDFIKYSYGNFIQDLNGEKRMLTINTLPYADWKIVGVFYMDEIAATKKETSIFVKWILFFGVVFFIVILAFISAKISQPIKQLEQSMKMVEEGRFDINIDIKGEDEVVRLSKTFNMMISRIRQLMNQIVVEQEAKRKSELNALQAQINPHFLYNTLDSIVWMAENEKSGDVITMVTSLARLFRISISKGKHIITVNEELIHARNYLIIQKMRYKNKFEFSFQVQEEILKYKTLKLILQPIIENAIYHGIEYMVDEGLITIWGRIMDGKLLFEVRDDGLGMKKDILENILSREAIDKKTFGVGVKNVHERIRLYFGNEYGLEIESELEEGTSVKIWLPLIEEEDYE